MRHAPLNYWTPHWPPLAETVTDRRHTAPHSRATWFHCPDSPRMQRGHHSGLYGAGGAMCAGIASHAGGVEVVLIGGGPHGCGALVIVETCSPNLGEHIFRQPSPELKVSGKQPPPFIQRRAVCKPSFDGVCLTGCDTLKRPLRSIGEATTAACTGRGGYVCGHCQPRGRCQSRLDWQRPTWRRRAPLDCCRTSCSSPTIRQTGRTDAATWFHCPDIREMRRGDHSGLYGP